MARITIFSEDWNQIATIDPGIFSDTTFQRLEAAVLWGMPGMMCLQWELLDVFPVSFFFVRRSQCSSGSSERLQDLVLKCRVEL